MARQADLTTSRFVYINNDALLPGQLVNFTVGVFNYGNREARNVDLGLYLSTDDTITPGADSLLASYTLAFDVPANGGNVGFGTGAYAFGDIAPGKYFLGVYVDNNGKISESSESNNFSVIPINVAPPNLVALPFDPSKVARGFITQGPNVSDHVGPLQFSYDFSLPSGTPVLAVASGKVIDVRDHWPDNTSGAGKDGFGNYVTMRLDNGTYVTFCHLRYDSVDVNVGQHCDAGAIIARSGNTGNSTGPHLHIQFGSSRYVSPAIQNDPLNTQYGNGAKGILADGRSDLVNPDHFDQLIVRLISNTDGSYDPYNAGNSEDRLLLVRPKEVQGGAYTIDNFNPNDDKILIDSQNFQPFGATGALTYENFALDHANDSNDYFFFNTVTSKLYYDPDGTGPKAASLLLNLPSVTYFYPDDIELVASDRPTYDSADTSLATHASNGIDPMHLAHHFYPGGGMIGVLE